MIASKRMFASSVVESDQFLDMPGTAQLLYFHLGMRADNDGVVDSAKQIMRIIGAADGDMRVLIEAGYVIVMPDRRIIVITAWRINNNGIRFDSAHNTHGRYYELIKNLGTGTDGKYYLRESSGRSPGELPETYRGVEKRGDEIKREEIKRECLPEEPKIKNSFFLEALKRHKKEEI